MHIVLYHDALIPPPKYGGTERIVGWLAKALTQLGHRVTLIAKVGSHIQGVSTLTAGPGGPHDSEIPSDADFIHLWGTPSTPPSKPFLITIQGNGRPGEKFHPNTVFISRKHAENHGARHYVYNGIDVSEYPCDSERKDHLVFLAKAAWKVKNLAGSIEIARAANLPLYVMGSRDLPWNLQRKLPSFGGVRYFGMVGDSEKREILKNARALLFPVRWPEPFGIAITEALASGCPVFGTPYGSLPEIVTESVGALSTEASTLLARLVNTTFPPETCRARVLEGFSHLQMAESYLKLYQRVLSRGRLGDGDAPMARFTEPAESLLFWRGLRS